jgi:hypothetical protein
MNARQQNQANTISIYIYALRAKLERLDQLAQAGKLKDKHLTVEGWLFLRNAEIDDLLPAHAPHAPRT